MTLCGRCIRTSVLGNLIYGLIGNYAGFPSGDVVGAPALGKAEYNRYAYAYEPTPIIPNDNNSYLLGFMIANPVVPATLSSFCNQLNSNLGDGRGLLQGNKDGTFNDTSTCKSCAAKTSETRHGGSETPRSTL